MVPEHPGDHLEDGHQGKPGHPGSAGPGPLPRCGWVQAAGGAGPAATENLGGSGREGTQTAGALWIGRGRWVFLGVCVSWWCFIITLPSCLEDLGKCCHLWDDGARLSALSCGHGAGKKL